MNNPNAYDRAKKSLEARYGFYIHLTVYVLVNILLVIINLTRSPGDLWFVYPMLGWGIGVFFHALGVFVFAGRGSMITEEMIKREMRRKA